MAESFTHYAHCEYTASIDSTFVNSDVCCNITCICFLKQYKYGDNVGWLYITHIYATFRNTVHYQVCCNVIFQDELI